LSRKRKRKKGATHVGMDRRTINGCQEWKDLSGAAKILYWHIKGRFNGSNNGRIELPYSAMKGVKGCSASTTIAKAAEELEKKKWIFRSQRGGLYKRKTLYGLTFKYDNYANPKK